jgi:hypothetical protein
MVKETVKYIDGTTADVDVARLGFRKANQIARKHIPINSLSFGKDSDAMTIHGDIDLMGMIVSCLETISGLDLDKLEAEEANRLFKSYFQKDVIGSLGQGGNPN